MHDKPSGRGFHTEFLKVKHAVPAKTLHQMTLEITPV